MCFAYICRSLAIVKNQAMSCPLNARASTDVYRLFVRSNGVTHSKNKYRPEKMFVYGRSEPIFMLSENKNTKNFLRLVTWY